MLANHFWENFKTVSRDGFIYTMRCYFSEKFHKILLSHRYKQIYIVGGGALDAPF